MKNTKHILVAALAALSIGSASAETIYVTGSTAFRSAANTALSTMTGATVLAQDNATLGSAGNVNIRWVNGGLTNLVKVHWSGSEAGIQSILKPSATFNYLPDSASGTVSSSIANDSHVGNIAFSDTYQSTSIFNGTKAGDGFSYPTVTADTQVGVVAFTWVASKGFPGSNINAQIARNLLANGFCSVALFTGNTANSQDVAYLLGRNRDSGTRLTTFAEMGYGANSGTIQFAVATNGIPSTNNTATLQGTTTTNSLITYPAEFINGVGAIAGNSGYSSGGTLCGFMTNGYAPQPSFLVDGTVNSTPLGGVYTGNTYLIGYAGQSDADSKVSAGLIKLSYDGVAASQNAIIQGQYPFWGYEHCLKSPTASATATTFYNALCAKVLASSSATLSPNVALGDMQVSRAQDGGVITQNY